MTTIDRPTTHRGEVSLLIDGAGARFAVAAVAITIGVIGSGIVLAEMLGYWSAPTLWLWVALDIGILMLIIGFGPLHFITTRMAVEFSRPEPDNERLDELFGKAMAWGLLQTILLLGIIFAMTGLRWGL